MTYESQLQKLRIHYRKFGNLPTYDRMREIFNCKSRSTAYYTVNRLIEADFLKRQKQRLIPGPKFDEMSFFHSVKAGFPSPAEEKASDRMSLDQYLIDQPGRTVFMRVKGDSMKGAGILNGDIAVVERRSDMCLGQTVVVNLEGEMVIKKLGRQGDTFFLESANSDYPDLPLKDYMASDMVGVVKAVVRKL